MRVVWCFFGRVAFILVTKIIKATAVYILLILRCFSFILMFINCTNIVCARFNFVLRTCMFVTTGQSSQVSLAFYPRYTKLTKHKIAKFANLSFLDCFPVILEWQAAALNEVAAWLTMTYLIRAKTPLVKNITYFSVNLIDAYTTSTLKGAILKAMRFLLIESLRNYSVNFFRDFWTPFRCLPSSRCFFLSVTLLSLSIDCLGLTVLCYHNNRSWSEGAIVNARSVSFTSCSLTRNRCVLDLATTLEINLTTSRNRVWIYHASLNLL